MGALKIVPLELILLLVAFWHSLYWFITRTADNSDEPWGLISLATVFILVILSWNRKSSFFNAGKLVPVCVVLVSLYCVCFAMVPPLVRCLIAVCAAGVVLWTRCIPGRRNALALFGFLILSSPVLASLQFFVGFPLRLLITNITAAIMQFSGTAVAVAGTSFEHQNQLILVDSPCSGINMLWAGLYFCFVICWTKQLSALRSVLLLCFSVIGVLFTNVARATIMVYIEILRDRGFNFHDVAHDFVSVASFITLAIALAVFGNMLARERFRLPDPLHQGETERSGLMANETETFNENSSHEVLSNDSVPKLNAQGAGAKVYVFSLVVASAVAFLLPFFQVPYHEDTTQIVRTEFPNQFEGRGLKPVKLSETETRFSTGFPGRIAKFTDGSRTILFRQVNKPTRQLHPSSDCYKGNCFQLHPMAALRDEDGKIWSRFSAVKNGQRLEVREIVSDSKGRSWSDISSWYWSAILGKTQSPWIAVTVASVAK